MKERFIALAENRSYQRVPDYIAYLAYILQYMTQEETSHLDQPKTRVPDSIAYLAYILLRKKLVTHLDQPKIREFQTT